MQKILIFLQKIAFAYNFIEMKKNKNKNKNKNEICCLV